MRRKTVAKAGGTRAYAKRVRAPFVVREDLLERARAIVYYFGEGLTLAKLGEEGMELAVAKYERAYARDRGRPVPALPQDAQIPRGPR
jgi:hypothetical protein